MLLRTPLSLTLLLAALAAPSWATDGRIEINQTIALAGGVNGSLVDDPPGFPVTITEPGGYVLTGNLIVDPPDGETDGVFISASDVSIDFNGFGLIGPDLAGSGLGVRGLNRISLENGFVREFGGDCIWLGLDARVERMVAQSCEEDGIQVGSGGLVIANRSMENAGTGLVLASDAGYVDNLVTANMGGAVSGGKAMGGNVCGGKTCSSPPRRRFYLTVATFDGNSADDAGNCADGFHFASMWEIHDPSQLEYDTTLGVTQADSGAGPSALDFGWVRTGAPSTAFTGIEGFDNCSNWTTTAIDTEGTQVRPHSSWTGAGSRIGPWEAIGGPCVVDTSIWCVQD